jgi:hypothetical protein
MTTTSETERRKSLWECKSHAAMVDRLEKGDIRMAGIEEKINQVLSNQLQYMNNQTELAVNVQKIKGVVENGLKKSVEELTATANDFHQKAQLINDFAWFIKLINDFRAGLFKKVLKYAFIGALLALAYTFVVAYGNKAFPKLLEKLL